jgi:hypothetical protein
MSATRQACNQCPFRDGSAYGYDDNAHFALDSITEPSCHRIVGATRIFESVHPSEAQVCIGYRAWQAGKPGYRVPENTTPGRAP